MASPLAWMSALFDNQLLSVLLASVACWVVHRVWERQSKQLAAQQEQMAALLRQQLEQQKATHEAMSDALRKIAVDLTRIQFSTSSSGGTAERTHQLLKEAHTTLRGMSLTAGHSASNTRALALMQLSSNFPHTPLDVLHQQIHRRLGSAADTFVELKQWSPVELRQPLKDQEGREYFTWRVPLEQWRREGRTDTQVSSEFEREGDRWRLQLVPLASNGHVGAFLELLFKDRPAGYSVERSFRLTALHPTDASRRHTLQSDKRSFTRSPDNWGSSTFFESDEYQQWLHNGWLTLQVVVWRPPPPPPEPAVEQKEAPICGICYDRPPSVLLFCCNNIKHCDQCIDTVLTGRAPRCPLCRASIDSTKIRRGVRL